MARKPDEVIPDPIEGVDFFVIKRVRYELHVEGTFFMTADEECDDFEIDSAKVDFDEAVIVSERVVSSEERRIDDPTKSFDRNAWKVTKRLEHGVVVRPHEKQRPASETTLGAF